jgi:putative copper resistance protein D
MQKLLSDDPEDAAGLPQKPMSDAGSAAPRTRAFVTVQPPGGDRATPARRRLIIRRRVALAVAAVVVVGAAAVAATWWARRQSASGPLLPVSWCRWGQGAVPPPLEPGRLFDTWQLDGVAVAVLFPVTCAYLWATLLVRTRHPARPWPWLRTASFLVSVVVVLLATCGAIAVYDQALFSFHMIQHLMLIMVAPPLLVAGRPLTLLLHVTRNPAHRRIVRVARSRLVSLALSPPAALAGYTVTIIGTHLTRLMGVFMRHPWLGQLEHLLYLVAGYQFFVLLFGDEPIRWKLSMPGRLALCVLAMGVDTFAGLVLLQAQTPIAMVPHNWGAGPLRDTQTGGAIMWVGGDGIMVVLIVLLFRSWTRRPEAVRRARSGWLERTRAATFAAHTGYQPGAGSQPAAGTAPAAGGATPAAAVATRPRSVDLDDDVASWQAYNAWLERLNHGR